MSRERDREYLKQRAREARESLAASSATKEQEQQRAMFDVKKTSNNKPLKNNMEKILGRYEVFKSLRGDRSSLLGVYQQPATPIAHREPIHDPNTYQPVFHPPLQPAPISETGTSSSTASSSSSSNSSSSQRSLPPPNSSRNSTTRPPKTLPGQSSKPPHPASQHAQPRNDEVKGNLKSGPSSGPGDGGGGSSKVLSSTKPNLPPLKLESGGGGDVSADDPVLQKIRSEMTIKNPVSAILPTPRPDHHHAGFAFNSSLLPHKNEKKSPSSEDAVASSKSSRRLPDEDHAPKFNKPPDLSALKNQKPLDGGSVKGDLALSEESEDEQGGSNGSGQLQSSNTKPLLSPISGKTSEDSSSEEDSSDDSDVSSNNSTEDEQPASEPSSPKSQGGDKSPNPWKLDKFIPPRKIKSPSQEKAKTGPAIGHTTNDSSVAEKVPAQSQRKRSRRNSKVAPSSATHRESRHNRDTVGHSEDSSDDGEPHLKPTPRALPEVRLQKAEQTVRKPDNVRKHDSESDSDSVRPSKSDKPSKDSSKLPDRSRNLSDPVIPRESTRRSPKKKMENKKETGAKPESGRSGREVKSREYITYDDDSDSDSIVDVESTTPVKVLASQRNTPSRTPKEVNGGISSPLKARHSSPHVSPMPVHSVPSKNSSKRTPLIESQSSEPLVNSRNDDLFGRNQNCNSDKSEIISKEKGPLSNSTFIIDKNSKKGRERDPVIRGSSRKSKPHRETKKSERSSSGSRDRSKSERRRGVSESSPLDNRLSGRSGTSPFIDKLSESPIVSPEPKVPNTPIHYDYGTRKFTCTIPLSLIDKVPKHSANGVSSVSKCDVKEKVDKKEGLDNRTTGKGGKGKRKTCEPNTKDMCNEDKKTLIISSIFRAEKIKKEPKMEPFDIDDCDHEKISSKSSSNNNYKVKEEVEEPSMVRPSSVGRRSVSSSPLPSSTPNSTSSRQHKKKKKDSLPERSQRSPSSNNRAKPRCSSERLAPDYSTLNSVGDTNSLDSCDVNGRMRALGADSDHGLSRKRERERESSLESTRSSSHSESGDRRSKKSRLSKSKEVKDSAVKSPVVRPGSQRVVESNTSTRSWSQEKEPQQPSYPQRPRPSQQSSQVKSETQATPSTDNGYHHSRPASEHDSMLDGSSYRSTDQPGSSDAASENGAQMVPPQSHRQSSTPAFAPSASASPAIHDPSAWQVFYANSENRVYPSYFDRRLGPEISTDYMGYMNMAKNLKHNADAETDRCRQGMKYLEAALYFILSGKAMEHDCETEPSASLRIYTDTLSFIKFVASVFMREKQEGSLNSKLAVISFRCQSLLSLKIYNMRRQEHKDTQRRLNSYFKNFTKSSSGEGSSNANNTSGNANSWNGQRTSGSPSHPSQTPSPAGSVGSEGSQSSGYTTSTEGTRSKNGPPQVGHTPPHPQPPSATPTVPVPTVIHNLLIKQNQLSGHLATAHDMWIEADNYVFKNGIQDFFIELDRACSPLTLHSSLTDLVYYAYCGLHRLKE